MRHNDEIKEIRNMMNTMVSSNRGNFPTSIHDDELSEGVTYLTTRDTNLSADIIVDSGETYKEYKHPLCLFIVDGEIVHPITISNNPSATDGYEIPRDIFNFIVQNVDILFDFANMRMDGSKFFAFLREWKSGDNKTTLVAEMSTYSPESTELPVWIYVDDTGSWKRSGHNQSYRMKFQQDRNITSPRKWMPIAIPSLEIMDKETVPPCTIQQKK